MKKRGQVGVEYMIIIGFVTIAIVFIVAFAFLYSNQIKDRIVINQVENFAAQLISSSESIFFAGEPSKATIKLYLPEGVGNINITQNLVIITTSVSSGENKRGFQSKVPLTGTITPSKGIKRLILEARSDYVQISHAP